MCILNYTYVLCMRSLLGANEGSGDQQVVRKRFRKNVLFSFNKVTLRPGTHFGAEALKGEAE